MFKQIGLALQEYEKFRELLHEQIAHASADEIKILAQKIEEYDRNFLLNLQLYIDKAYKTAGTLVKENDDQEIQKIKNMLMKTK